MRANGEAGSSAAFVTTHWSIVLTAQERSPAADAALEKLCRTYWWPLYGFVRRQGYSPEAETIAQLKKNVDALFARLKEIQKSKE